MPQTDFLPRPDFELNTWAQTFASVIASDAPAFGISAPQSAALSAAVAAYSAALAAASEPDTRTRVAVANKEVARVAMIEIIRDVARRVRANSAVTDGQRVQLGLKTAGGTAGRSTSPISRPMLALSITSGRRHDLRIFDESPAGRRGLPADAAGAQVFYFAGDDPPTDLSRWRFAGLATRGQWTIEYDGADIGKTAHIRAQWYNRRGQNGPASDAVRGMIAA